MLDQVIAGVVVAFIVQGLKQLGFNISDNVAKVVTIAVGALFFFANGLIDTFVPPEFRPLLQSIVNALKYLLGVAVPPGIYGFVKMLAAKK